MMTNEDIASVVVRAREALRDWDGKAAAAEVAEKIRNALQPLSGVTGQLSAEAVQKLDEIHARLEAFAAQRVNAEDREALDLLMLGLWIRIESAAPPAGDGSIES